MKLFAASAVFTASASALALNKQPIISANLRNPGSVKDDSKFASSAANGKPQQTYRNAWDDCGGVGASATMRTRIMAAKITGQAPPVKFVRHAAQDCTGGEGLVHPGAEIWSSANKGKSVATKALGVKVLPGN